MIASEFFASTFAALTTADAPFPWQARLFEDFVSGEFPTSCSLPTGLGKTSVIPIWLLALASNPALVPRRLVYVVNRRTVVDQATNEAKKLRDRLASVAELLPLKQKLAALCSTAVDVPLAISTLRGQFADNGEWRSDPSHPAVIVGTVDMIGSRLLFNGYGIGFKTRPTHAGLLGHDVLLVHDEAHLEPAFQKLLTAIQSEQTRHSPPRRFQVLELTATSRSDGEQFSLTSKDHQNPTVRKRLDAKKGIAFHSAEMKGVADEVAKQAVAANLSGSQKAILVFVRGLEDVRKVTDKLKNAHLEFQTLTGTKRGYERDRMAQEDPVFVRFLQGSDRPSGIQPATGTVYLVCTSAGEVGINISADHLVCDLSPFDSMAQRLGRVNRFGDGDALIEVVHPSQFDTADQFDVARQRTLELLRQLNQRTDDRFDASPQSLGSLPAEARQQAFSPQPIVPHVDDILFDAWSLTTIRDEMPGRPLVVDWLHGVDEGSPPETHVAWRQEVAWLKPNADLCDDDHDTWAESATLVAEDVLDDWPLKPHELLRDVSNRIRNEIESLAQTSGDQRAWLVDDFGKVTLVSINELAAWEKRNNKKEYTVEIANRTIVLPPSVGGLTQNGMLDGNVPFANEIAYDVADEWRNESGQQIRCRIWQGEAAPAGMRLVRTLIPGQSNEDEADDQTTQRVRMFYVRPKNADDEAASWSATTEQTLTSHLALARDAAERIVDRLGLEEPLRSAVVLAAKWHDLGKHRKLWQNALRNFEYPAKVLAKSNHRQSPIGLRNYRHEFGSLIDVTKDAEFEQLSEESRELVLHLIAAHHGRARPHFPNDEAIDPQHSDSVSSGMAVEVPRRFSRLQKQFGHWGLAWLESLVRAADVLASQPAKESLP